MPRSTAVRGGSEWRDHLAADVARAHIERILKESGWNLTHAAETLGIDRSTLYSKINSPGLQRHVVPPCRARPRACPTFFDKRASPAPAGNCFCECPQPIMRKEPASELLRAALASDADCPFGISRPECSRGVQISQYTGRV